MFRFIWITLRTINDAIIFIYFITFKPHYLLYIIRKNIFYIRMYSNFY